MRFSVKIQRRMNSLFIIFNFKNCQSWNQLVSTISRDAEDACISAIEYSENAKKLRQTVKALRSSRYKSDSYPIYIKTYEDIIADYESYCMAEK